MSHAITKGRAHRTQRSSTTSGAQNIRLTWCPIGMPFTDLAPPENRKRANRGTRTTSQAQVVRTE